MQVLEVSAEYVQHALSGLAKRTNPAASTIWVHFGVDGTASSFKLEVRLALVTLGGRLASSTQTVGFSSVIAKLWSSSIYIVKAITLSCLSPHSGKPSTRRTSGCPMRQGGSRTMKPSTQHTQCITLCVQHYLWTNWQVVTLQPEQLHNA